MLSSPSAGSSVFSSLPERPPTPPKNIEKDVDDALRFLEEGHQDPPEDTRPSRVKSSTDTPPQKSPVVTQLRGSNASKKVDFSPDLTYHNPPKIGQFGSPVPRIVRQSPALRVSKPLRSILKQSNDALPPTPDDLDSKLSYFSPQEPGSFRKMLQSVITQLGAPSRDGRRDAYLCLNGALKAHDDLPETQALVEKMGLLQQFICRDMAWKDDSTGKPDTQIVSQALTLTCALLYIPDTNRAMDDDFRTFIIDRSTSMIEQTELPKAIFKQYLHILSQQRFSSAIMTQNRADKVITALQSIEDRCTGNSVVAARLVAYQRLAQQQPSVMLGRMQDWIEHVFHGMLSSIGDIRTRGIEACHAAALHLGMHHQATKTLFEVFDAETEEGTTYCDYFNQRLMEMTSDKDLAPYVPQIWAAVILFFRSKRKPLDKWPKLRLWLATIQKCLNSGDLNVKHYAHIAWNKLMYAVMPDSSTTQAVRSMLRLPILKVLERRGNDKFSQHSKELALDSYCNLLHYGLRPTLSQDELDSAWKMYVEEVLINLAQSGSRGQHSACRVLHGLLKKNSGMWNETAAVEQSPIKPEELPHMESKWIRSHLSKVIKVIEPIISAGMWSPPHSNNAADVCWKLLLQAVAEAGSQEVKTSNELKIALAELVNFCRRLWHSPAKARSETEASLWLDRYQLLLDTCVEALGAGHFVEDILAKTPADEVEATPTPSNRTSKHPKTAYSPFVFLFALYYQPPQSTPPNDSYMRSAAWFLNVLAGARGSASGTIGLLHRTLQFCSDQASVGDVPGRLWKTVADAAVGALKMQTSTTPQHNVQTVGVALRSALNVLTFGLRYVEQSPSCAGKAMELYEAACSFAEHYAQHAGVALGVMEPLAKTVIDTLDDISISAAMAVGQAVMDHGVWPRNRHELEQGRKALWSISLDPPAKTPVFDPFEHVYNLMNKVPQLAYRQLTESDKSLEPLMDYFESAVAFLRRCPSSILPSSLSKVQSGLTVLIEDQRRLSFPLAPRKNHRAPTIANRLVQLWPDVLRLVQSLSRNDSILDSLGTIFVAGLSSPSQEIVNNTITFWNLNLRIGERSLEYPPSLLPVLRGRRDAGLELGPGFPEGGQVASFPPFAEIQNDYEGMRGYTTKPSPMENNTFVKPVVPPKSTPKLGKTKPKPKARLRHDDSQMEFAPISSSPRQVTFDESQNLTEHQKEVKARQHGDAQMFPEFSSSPGQLSNGKGIAKKLDFSSDGARGKEDEVAAVATPTGLADGNGNPMSDDLPSSPTPRASAVAQEQELEQYSDDEATDIVDPPSSPPREDDDEEPVDELPKMSAPEDQPYISSNIDQDARVAESTYLASDTALPTAQLEREAAAAAEAAEEQAPQEDPEVSAEHLHRQRTIPSQRGLKWLVERDGSSGEQKLTSEQTPSIIEASFVDQEEAADTPSNADTPRRERKRRHRSSDTVHHSRPAKQVKRSPFGKLWSHLTASREEDDDDIGDEIVVSQPRVSVEAAGEEEEAASPTKSEHGIKPERTTESQEQPAKRKRGRPKKSAPEPEMSQLEPEPEPERVVESQESQPIKRRPGRPPKNPESRQASQTSTGANTRLKRRASTLSNATTDAQASTSFVRETPAPTKSRKAARLSQEATDAGSSSRRRGRPSASKKRAEESQEPEPDADDEEAEEEEEESTAFRGTETETAEPKSILARLRGVLSDCKKMVFGSVEEERALDDVLFEIRREVHDAGRRAREQQLG